MGRDGKIFTPLVLGLRTSGKEESVYQDTRRRKTDRDGVEVSGWVRLSGDDGGDDRGRSPG